MTPLRPKLSTRVTGTPSSRTEKYLDRRRQDIDGALDRWLPSEKEEPSILHRAMRYSVLAGGKRIRPLLCLVAAESKEIDGEALLKASCALELLHTYSLIHDDLPSMDDDDLRRGKPTSHKVFGEATAILTGDALLTLSFEWLSSTANQGIPSKRVLKALQIFAKAAGHQGMVGGQVLDIAAEGKKISFPNLRRIHEWKTGALIAASVEMGAVLGGFSASECRLIKHFGEKIGLLFQIVDDILDEEGETKKLGKQTGSDRKKGKATYPSILGMTQARQMAEDTYLEAIAILAKMRAPLPRLKEITESLYRRTS